MEVKLILASGENAGSEIRVPGPKFFIGRGDDCHLRPNDDTLSRHHCVLIVEGGLVTVRDMGSKHGTFVNGERVAAERGLSDGDRLSMGRLEFEVRFETAGVEAGPPAHDEPQLPPAEHQPAPVEQQPAGTAASSSPDDDLDLDRWLSESPSADPGAESLDLEAAEKKRDRKEKQRQGKIVGVWEGGRWKAKAPNPTQAAADRLKDFFEHH